MDSKKDIGTIPGGDRGSVTTGDQRAEHAALNKVERDLLSWLGESDFSQYGECHGTALNSLIAKGLVQIHLPGAHQSGFIARGNSDMYRAVSLTDAGRAAINKPRDDGTAVDPDGEPGA